MINLSLLPSSKAIDLQPTAKDVPDKSALIEKSAHEFEAAFISQMLTFSGLADALTLGGGEDMSAFASFYIESLSTKISEGGGFGLAEKFYESLSQGMDNMEHDSVNFGRM